MRLSDYRDQLNIKILRDGEFDTLGNCTDGIEVSFLSFLGKERFLDKMSSRISCLITTAELADKIPESIKGLAVAEDPKLEYVTLHNLLSKEEAYVGKSFATIIGKNCDISPLAVVPKENVIIGDDVTIGPFTVIHERTEIGNRVTIRENCIIGGKTFNYATPEGEQLVPMIDCGKVIIEDDVDIYGLTYIDSCPLPTETTRFMKGTQIGACVHVAHGSQIGEKAMIPCGADIAGNCRIGSEVFMGPSAVISNRITVGDGAHITLGSVVTKNVEPHQTVSGNFAVEHKKFIKEVKSWNSET
ncbi:MAG: hypothetical protein HUJ70_02705 [Pseudobutyrivibrio sp.]|nr:hypothetical protein [Pseudobutyrivibrio sp.]